MNDSSNGPKVFSHIVVGTDGSKTARKAVALAVELARCHDAVLHVVNAYRLPIDGPGVVLAGPAGVGDEEASADFYRQASEKLLAESIGSMDDIKVEAHSQRGGPVDVVIGVAEQVGAELIVVGSKGMRGVHRMIGSVPDSIAHGAPCHVLIAKTT